MPYPPAQLAPQVVDVSVIRLDSGGFGGSIGGSLFAPYGFGLAAIFARTFCLVLRQETVALFSGV